MSGESEGLDQLARMALSTLRMSLKGAKELLFAAQDIAQALPGHETVKDELALALGAIETADREICKALGLM